jgi:hypothetical protein
MGDFSLVYSNVFFGVFRLLMLGMKKAPWSAKGFSLI